MSRVQAQLQEIPSLIAKEPVIEGPDRSLALPTELGSGYAGPRDIQALMPVSPLGVPAFSDSVGAAFPFAGTTELGEFADIFGFANMIMQLRMFDLYANMLQNPGLYASKYEPWREAQRKANALMRSHNDLTSEMEARAVVLRRLMAAGIASLNTELNEFRRRIQGVVTAYSAITSRIQENASDVIARAIKEYTWGVSLAQTRDATFENGEINLNNRAEAALRNAQVPSSSRFFEAGVQVGTPGVRDPVSMRAMGAKFVRDVVWETLRLSGIDAPTAEDAANYFFYMAHGQMGVPDFENYRRSAREILQRLAMGGQITPGVLYNIAPHISELFGNIVSALGSEDPKEALNDIVVRIYSKPGYGGKILGAGRHLLDLTEKLVSPIGKSREAQLALKNRVASHLSFAVGAMNDVQSYLIEDIGGPGGVGDDMGLIVNIGKVTDSLDKLINGQITLEEFQQQIAPISSKIRRLERAFAPEIEREPFTMPQRFIEAYDEYRRYRGDLGRLRNLYTEVVSARRDENELAADVMRMFYMWYVQATAAEKQRIQGVLAQYFERYGQILGELSAKIESLRPVPQHQAPPGPQRGREQAPAPPQRAPAQPQAQPMQPASQPVPQQVPQPAPQPALQPPAAQAPGPVAESIPGNQPQFLERVMRTRRPQNTIV